MRDLKDMQFINHIFSKHRIPAALIITAVMMLVVNLISSTQADDPHYAPGETLNPLSGPGTSYVEFPSDLWTDIPAGTYGGNDWPESANFTGGNIIVGPTPSSQMSPGSFAANPMSNGSTSGALYLYGTTGNTGGGRIFFGDIGSEWTNPYIGERWTRTDTIAPSDSDKLDISAKEGIYFLTGGGNTINAAGLLARDRMVINSSGNVGIGTITPAGKLEVVGGNIKATGGLIIETRNGSDPTSPVDGQMWLRTDIF